MPRPLPVQSRPDDCWKGEIRCSPTSTALSFTQAGQASKMYWAMSSEQL